MGHPSTCSPIGGGERADGVGLRRGERATGGGRRDGHDRQLLAELLRERVRDAPEHVRGAALAADGVERHGSARVGQGLRGRQGGHSGPDRPDEHRDRHQARDHEGRHRSARPGRGRRGDPRRGRSEGGHRRRRRDDDRRGEADRRPVGRRHRLLRNERRDRHDGAGRRRLEEGDGAVDGRPTRASPRRRRRPRPADHAPSAPRDGGPRGEPDLRRGGVRRYRQRPAVGEHARTLRAVRQLQPHVRRHVRTVRPLRVHLGPPPAVTHPEPRPRVDGPQRAWVRFGETRGHRFCLASPDPRATPRNATCRRSRFSATTSCGVMCVTPDSGSTWCGRPGREQRRGQAQGVRGDDVVVGEPVDQQQRRRLAASAASSSSDERS